MKKRDISIDILKFFAALIITWSHFEKPLGDYSMLATGGTFGDVLFFFCSGYTLLLGKDAGFFNWYKRRINRIYPTVFAWALIASVAFGANKNMAEILLEGGGWFVSCIMIYYVILWFLKRYAINRLYYAMGATVILTLVVYFVWGTGNANGSMYHASCFKWIPYFLYMLLGAMYGLKYKERTQKGEIITYKMLPSLLWLLVSVVLYYVFFSFYKYNDILNAIQLLSVIPLLGVCIYFYRLCNTSVLINLYHSKVGNTIIRFIGGLCLEIYLVQNPLLTDKMNNIFPLNILIIFAEIIVLAYILRCVARIWSQTFKDGEYDLKWIVNPF